MFSSPLIYILSLTWTEALARALGIFTIYIFPNKISVEQKPFFEKLFIQTSKRCTRADVLHSVQSTDTFLNVM